MSKTIRALTKRTRWALISLILLLSQFTPLLYFVQSAQADATSVLYPSGDGQYSSWYDNYDAIDEADPNCGTNEYISEDKAGRRDSFQISSSIPNGSTITSVAIYAWDMGDTAIGGTYKTFLRIDDTDTDFDAATELTTSSTSNCVAQSPQIINVGVTKSSSTRLEIGVLKVNTTKVKVGALRTVITYTLPAPQADLTATKTNNVSDNATIDVPFNWNIRVQNTGAATATFTNGQNILRDERPSNGVSSYDNAIVSLGGGTTGSVNCADSGSGSLDPDINCTANGTVTIPVDGYIDITYITTPDETGNLINPRSGGSCAVDNGSAVSESNDSNNTCSNTVTVSEAPPAINPSLGQSCGIDVALVIDTSTSIDDTELATMKTAMKGFVSAFEGTPTRMAVVSFDDSAVIQSNFTSDLDSLEAVIDGVDGSGYTNWDDALYDTRNLFPDRADKPDLIVFTSDGNPTTSDGPLSDLQDAIVEANAAKTASIRIITLGIGGDVNASNLQQISSADAYYSATDFNDLADALSGLATDLCGGTITVQKLVDKDGDLSTTDDQTPASGWEFDVNGTPSNPVADTTDANGYTDPFDVNAGTYSVVETPDTKYNLLSAVCSGATNNGSYLEATLSVNGIVVSNTDIVSCVFINTKKPQKVDICHATDSHSNPYVVNSPDASGDVSGHDGHDGDVWYPGIADHSWGDIIPPFDYDGGSYPGKNWTTYGQAVYENDCVIPGGTLIVNKVVVNNNGGKAEADDFSYQINGNTAISFEADGSNSQTVDAGKYTITEPTVTDYTTTYDNCTDIIVASGETETCTITNNDDAPGLVLVKNLLNTYNAGAIKADWTLTATGPTTLSGDGGATSGSSFDAGEYTLGETSTDWASSTYTASSWTCVGGTQVDNKITILLGEQVECTITNEMKPATLVVKKVVIDVDGDTKTANDFNFDYSGDASGSETFVEGADPLKGEYTLTLAAGTYTVIEPSEYSQGYSVDYDDSDEGDCDNMTIANGETVICTITNTRKTAPVYVNKFEDKNSDGIQGGDEGVLSGWTMNAYTNNTCTGDPVAYAQTGIDGVATINGLLVGNTYWINEVLQPGWTMTTSACREITILDTQTSNRIGFGNVQLGDIHGYKWEDINGNGIRDCADADDEQELRSFSIEYCDSWAEPLLAGWTIDLYRSNGDGGFETEPSATMVTSSDSEHFGWYWFEGLLPGQYKICEVNQFGWMQTYPVDPICHIVDLPYLNSITTLVFTENRVFAPEYNFGNQYIVPVLTLEKSNNSTTAKRVGDIVTYTLTLTNPNDFKLGKPIVIDTPPEGFEYIPGSWTANSNIRGDLVLAGISLEPTYASPGEWLFKGLGLDNDYMAPSEIFTLTYQVRINSLVTVGTYPDVAYATAWFNDTQIVFDNIHLLDSTNNPFVGTQVTVVEDAKPGTYKLLETGSPAILSTLTGVGMIGTALILYAFARVRKGNK